MSIQLIKGIDRFKVKPSKDKVKIKIRVKVKVYCEGQANLLWGERDKGQHVEIAWNEKKY